MVVRLSLPQNELRGELQASLQPLTWLQQLDLEGNELGPTIFDGAGADHLAQLRVLDIRNNDLQEPLPEWLSEGAPR